MNKLRKTVDFLNENIEYFLLIVNIIQITSYVDYREFDLSVIIRFLLTGPWQLSVYIFF